MNSTRELLELSAMDVLGLLDESEREAFERSFRAAPPEVQAAIRLEQLRVSKDEDLLPQVAPPPGLKSRVMSAISEAIASVSGHEPTVGYVGPVSGRRVMASATLWRAACLGFATAAVVMGAFVFQMSRLNRQTIAQFESNVALDVLRPTGVGFQRMLTNPAMINAHFTPLAADAEAPTRATIYVDRELGEAYLLCSDLPAGEYRLVIRHTLGGEQSEAEFRHNGGGLKVVHVEQIDPNDVNGLSIVADNGPRSEPTLVMRIGEGA